MTIGSWPIANEREKELLQQVLESQRWGGYHPFIPQLERQFAAFQQSAHGIAAINGTVTLEMMLEATRIGPGDEVIIPAISFVSTATAVSRVGAIPVFVDIEGDTFNIDPERAQQAISSQTKAIIAVHFGGPMADMDRLATVAAEHKLILFEDAAHAHGSEWNGRRAGSLGLAGSFSFQNSKVMTAGEGGLLTTNDDAFAAKLRSILDQGRKPGEGWFFHYELGTNYRMTAWQAAVLIAQLERLPAQTEKRRRSAGSIRESFGDQDTLRFQQVPRAAHLHTNYLLLGRLAGGAEDRDHFHRALTSAGVPCTPFYPHTLYNNPLYQKMPCRVEACPVAEACIRDAFWLPHRVLLSDDDTICEVVNALRAALPVATRR